MADKILMGKGFSVRCISCGKETDICYTDEGMLGLTHGHYRCRECYIKAGHPACLECGELLSNKFKFCPWCGTKLKEGKQK